MPKQNRIPIQYETFQRVDEDTNIDKLGNGVLASLDDMVLNNPYGSATIRGGYQLQNNNQTTNAISRMINVRDVDSQEYLIAGNGSLISRSTGGAWTDIKTGLTGTGGFQFTLLPKALAITNGADKPFILSGSDFGTSDNVEIAPPDMTSVTMQRTTDVQGNLTASASYRWLMVYKTATGEISNVSESIAFINSTSGYSNQTIGDGKLKFIFRVLPVSTDSRVTRKVLYRTESWVGSAKTTGTVYYRVADMENDIAIYVDDTADVDLDFGDVITFVRLPNSAEYTTRSNNRLWFANFVLPKITQFRPPIMAQDHGSSTEYPAGSGQNWDDGGISITAILSTVGNIVVIADSITGSGLIQNKYYQYMYTYLDHNGLESRPSYQTTVFQVSSGGSFHTITTAVYDSGRVGANNSAHHSPIIKARRIYRTEGQASSFTAGTKSFYFVEEQLIDTGTVTTKLSATFVDANNDDTSTLYAEDTEVQVSAVGWSRVDRPAFFALQDVKQIFAEESDPITGFLDDGNGVMIWKENSIIKLYHTGSPSNWYLRKVWNEHGCDVPLSLIKVGDTYYFQYRKKIYSMVSGQAPIDITYGRYASFDGMTIINVVGNDQWIVYSTTESSNHYQMIYDRVVKTWYKFNFATNDLTCTLMKKYDDIFAGNKNLPHAIVGKRMFDYDTSQTDDEISGGTIAIVPSITFPLFRVKGQHSKARNVVLDWIKVGSGTLKFTFVDDSGTTVNNISSPSDSGLTRLDLALVGLDTTKTLKLTLSGIIKQLNSIRIDLRPERQGVGV